MADLQELLRVDHAGEHGAVRICDGQLAVFSALKNKQGVSDLIRHMAEQEQEHLTHFDDLLVKHKVRPTALSGVWDMAGFALGAATALMGEKAAMACTAAVEEIIDEHYAEQLEDISNDPEHQELADTIRRFQADEVEHRKTALEHGAEEATGYTLLRSLIGFGCRTAIAVSKKI
jgi:ubiquinone biosynthesis monooxygenase Coq7